jgi:hypothetical protein
MIYFIQRPDGGRIKIGTTIRLSSRLKALCDEVGEDLLVLAVAEGGRDEEKGLHRRFADLRVIGEWFEPGDDLVGFIVAEGKQWDGSDENVTAAVRLELSTTDHERLERCSRERGLNMASYARMAVLKLIKEDEGRGS